MILVIEECSRGLCFDVTSVCVGVTVEFFYVIAKCVSM